MSENRTFDSLEPDIKVLCDHLEKAYPGISSFKYDGSTFSTRMKMALYIEMIRARLIP